MTEKSQNPHYILDSQEEVKRLSKMHEILKDAMGGLLLVPVELSAAPLRVLDSATADDRRAPADSISHRLVPWARQTNDCVPRDLAP